MTRLNDAPWNETSFVRVTLSKIVPNALTRSLVVVTVQVKLGLRRMNEAKVVNPSRLVIWTTPVVSRFGTDVPPGEQIGGSWMLAIVVPSQMTSRPAGNSMRASKAANKVRRVP